MGIILRDKTADFSAIAVGELELCTSVQSGLKSLHEIRSSASKAAKNQVDGPYASVSGGTFSSTAAEFTAFGQFSLAYAPENNGALSMAIIVKIISAGTSSLSVPFGCVGADPTANGAVYFANFNREIRFEATKHDAGGTFTEVAIARLTLAADASLDGTYEMFVGTALSEGALKLYRPKTGQVVTIAMGTGNFLKFSPAPDNLKSLGTSTEVPQGLASVAYWNREISAGEVGTYYSEIKEQVARYGLVI